MNRNIEDRNSKENIEKIYLELKTEQFIADLEKEFEEDLIKEDLIVEYLDIFGQAAVYLNFEDNFAIKDNIGKWKKSTANECIDLAGGNLDGMQILVS